MNWKRYVFPCLGMLMLSGCATMPTGPSVMALPGPGKSFEAFQVDDAACRRWAEYQTGLSPNDAVNQNLATGAAAGTLMGAGLGAAIGAISGHPGMGAAVGAASGLVGGTAMASGPAYAAGAEAQRRYDFAYQQCMYAKGNQIPGAVRRSPPPPPPPPAGYSAPPPDYSRVPPDYTPEPPETSDDPYPSPSPY
jgi:hypothetical protein